MIPIGQWLEAKQVEPAWPALSSVAGDSGFIPAPATDPKAAMEEVRAACDAQIEAERQIAMAALADARAQWIEQQSTVLLRSCSEAITALEEKLAAAVAGILEQLLPHAIAAMALVEFRTTLKQLLTSEPKSLRLAAPADIIEALRADFARTGTAIEFVESENCEMRAIADSTLIESRIGGWLATIGGAVT